MLIFVEQKKDLDRTENAKQKIRWKTPELSVEYIKQTNFWLHGRLSITIL